MRTILRQTLSLAAVLSFMATPSLGEPVDKPNAVEPSKEKTGQSVTQEKTNKTKKRRLPITISKETTFITAG